MDPPTLAALRMQYLKLLINAWSIGLSLILFPPGRNVNDRLKSRQLYRRHLGPDKAF
jgi:hypothetical protein